MRQRDLFTDRALSLPQRAQKWIDENPAAMAWFRRFARDALDVGRPIGIGAIAERVRWEVAVTTSGDFKVNNSYRAYIARALIAEDPRLAEIIETRRTQESAQEP